MKYQYFISSRFRNRDKVLELAWKLREKGKTVYCFLESPTVAGRVGRDPEEDMNEFEKRDWRSDLYIRKVFEYDLAAEKESECLILLLPGGKSAHIEAGIAYGLGKKCILIGEVKDAESLYCIFNESYPTIDDFIKSLD
ncbi:hypothetical protein M1271_06930 [Patescibacteria group bacterium]|nr:hypothetical protein [Patescibacteria group bacterium]MCL5797451.1 hypothetical protein [Patescibacteria group bacterium]